MKRAGSTSSLSSVACNSGPTRLQETPPTREAKVVKPGAKQKPRPTASPLNAVAPVEEAVVEVPEAPASSGTPKKNLGSVFAAAVDVHTVSASPVKSPDVKKTKTAQGSNMLCEALPQWPSCEPSNDAKADPQHQHASLVPGTRNPEQQQCSQKAVPEEPHNSVGPSRRNPKQHQCSEKAVPEEPHNSVGPSRRNPKQQQCSEKAVPKEPQQVSEHPTVEPQQKVSARIDADSQQGSLQATQVQESPSEIEQSSQGAVSWLAC